MSTLVYILNFNNTVRKTEICSNSNRIIIHIFQKQYRSWEDFWRCKLFTFVLALPLASLFLSSFFALIFLLWFLRCNIALLCGWYNDADLYRILCKKLVLTYVKRKAWEMIKLHSIRFIWCVWQTFFFFKLCMISFYCYMSYLC